MMVLFVGPNDLWSHRMRIAMSEKGLPAEILEIDVANPPPEMADLNPYLSVPTFVDRELALYDSRVIIDYLDERFQHPPLLPPNPVVRAQLRLALYRIERDWYGLFDALNAGDAHAKKLLVASIVSSAEIFRAQHYFMSDDFTIVDATIAPVLARLPLWGITLPASAAPVLQYAQRVFARPSVAATLPLPFDTESDHPLTAQR
jgi:RNA polymerase-associated protein